MARGWESKAVEMQMEERQRPASSAPGAPSNPALSRELEVLRLSRIRLVRELELARDIRLQELKKRALSFIDGRIEELSHKA